MAYNDRYSSRPEARPVPYWKHPKRAKEAIKLIIRALKTTAENVKGPKGIEGDPSLDTNRASRIFFVSGEPGSGKSTLYLTLRAMLSSNGGATFSEGYRETKTLNELQGVVRLLDPLDLEVAGDEGENLLAAVLVRLIEVLDKPGAVLSESCKGAIKELEELATDIGIAWEGNLKARAGELDPDTYSVEVMRTQRARLRVNDRLNNALNEIANHKCYDCNPGTLFVLPVDDFYLKPEASLQLLRLLRMISIPRLFFLVMGDINTVEALFIEKSLGDWTAVAGPGLFPPLSERLDEALTRARELRARYLRKLLPPAQRETIEAMDWHEALNVEVDLPDKNGGDVEVLQALLLKINLDRPFPETVPESESKMEDLLTFLVSPSLAPLDLAEKKRREKKAKEDEDAEPETQTEFDLKKARAAYTALQILDATPREIVDLGSALKEVINREQVRERVKKRGDVTAERNTPLLLSAVRDIVNLVREEHSFLNEEAQKVLGGVLPTRTYSPEDINFQMKRLYLEPSPRTWKEQVKERLWVRSHRSWDLSVNISFDELKAGKDAAVAQDPFAKLPPRPAAWFVLLHDLAWKWNPDSLSENLVTRLWDQAKRWEWKPTKSEIASPTQQESGSQRIAGGGVDDAFNQFILLFKDFVNDSHKKQRLEHGGEKREPNPSEDFRGWAMLKSEETWKHLPMPQFELFRDLDRFLFIWSKGLESLGKPEPSDVQKALNLWKLAGRIVLLDSYKDFANEGDDWYEDFAKGGNEWFKEFMEREGTFIERFDTFGEKRGMSFNYPSEGSEQIDAWRERLNDWDSQAIEFKKED
jgi:hypothetical protein